MSEEKIPVKALHLPASNRPPLVRSPFRVSLFLSEDDDCGFISLLYFYDSTPWAPGRTRDCQLLVLQGSDIKGKLKQGDTAFLGTKKFRRVTVEIT